jgi:hypothetical protein
VTGILGPWLADTGLANNGERIRLSMPGTTAGSLVTVDEVTYASEGDWAQRVRESTFNGWDWLTAASGGGASLDVELKDLEMLKGLSGISTHACSVRLPVLANDQNLQRLSALAAPLLPQAPQGLLIAGHGLYAWGDNLNSAMRHLEILEFLLEQHWRQLLLRAVAPPHSA